MRNREEWAPSKYQLDKNRWMASRNLSEVGIGSRLLGDLVALFYQSNIPRYAHGKLLDAGCGKAPLFAMYQPFITESICVDWPNSKHDAKFVDVQCDLAEGLPFKNQEFDTVILSDVLEHVFNPLSLWRELARVMKPGGVLLMNSPFYYWLHESPFDYYRYTEFALRRFAEETGLKILSFYAIGGTVEILIDIFAKHLQFLPVVGAPSANILQTVAYIWAISDVGKRVAHFTAKAFPYGYFLVAQKTE
ncbi:MAG: class I SAM-dependent methyltransferase [Caldilinea sp.]|uniref:class I SAM-dependent methyltransferase n=1 Tax=Caldilinea sp. TaxID=2293560 RepID=UPI003097B599